MLSTPEATFRWWTRHQLQYNAGLAMAGVLAFIAYAVVGSSFLPAKEEFEITLFTLFVQAIVYLAMMVAANVFYLLGPLAEIYLKPSDPDHFRRTASTADSAFPWLCHSPSPCCWRLNA